MAKADIQIIVGVNPAQFEKDMKKLTRDLSDMGKKIGGVGTELTKYVTGPIVAVGAGMLALAVKAGGVADRLGDLHDITGLTTQSIQEWQYVAKIAGVETETMTAAVEGLVKRLPQLEAEGGMATEQMAKLGLSFDDIAKMTPDEKMDTIIGKLADMVDPLERNAIGSSLFGGAWKDLAPILGKGSDGIALIRDEANAMGLVLSEDALTGADKFRVGMTKLQAQGDALFNVIGAKLGPVLAEKLLPIIETRIIPAIVGFAEKIANLITWFTNLDPTVQTIILSVIGFAAALGPLLMVTGKILTSVSTFTAALPLLSNAFGLLTSPTGIIIAALAALVVGGIYLYQNWDVIKAKAAIVWAGITGVVKNAANGIIGFINGIITAAERMVNAIAGAINKIPKITIPAWVPGIGGNSFGLPTIAMASFARVPLLADGGLITAGGLSLVGEAGPELLSLPRGAQVAPLGAGGGYGTASIIVELDGYTIARAIGQPLTDLIRVKTGLRI